MDLADRAIALYGRFSHGVRDDFERRIEAAGGHVARDLTRQSDALVVGALATTLIDSGALAARLSAARARGIPILSEPEFRDALAGRPGRPPATLPLATALAGTPFGAEDAALLAAFGLMSLAGDCVGFADAQVLRTAADLVAAGRTRAEVVRILARARDLAPRGRHRIVLTQAGEAALQWDDGVTTLEGQGVLALDETGHDTLEDLFEAAVLAEADGDPQAAARLYDQCARSDRKDPIAPYNLGNIRLAEGAFDQAALAYQQALVRDRRFSEARYNLAQALEGQGRTQAADAELTRLLAEDPDYADAVFNLAQLRLRAGDLAAARPLYQRYLSLGPPDAWAATARRAILYCDAALSA